MEFGEKVKIIILGSGTSVPLAYRASPSFILFPDKHPILFDMGPGTLRQLSKIGMSHTKIGRIFITHFHPDHTADLIHFLFVTRNLTILEKREKFIVAGPRGLKDFLKKLEKVYGKWLNIPPEIMEIEELDTRKPEKRGYKKFSIFSQPLKHTPHSLAYRVESLSDKSLVYSGDTGYCDEIVDLAKDSDLLILECSFPDGIEVEGHLTPSLAGRIATLANVKKLLLIHFYPEVLATDIAQQCRKTHSGELILGRDFLHISI